MSKRQTPDHERTHSFPSAESPLVGALGLFLLPMLKSFKLSAWMLAGVCFMAHFTGNADPVVWQKTRAEAVEIARNSGKLILLLAGRDTCGNCQNMKNTVCETSSVRQVLDTNYVCWYCLVDTSKEWNAYAAGLISFSLPLMCVIDPGDTNKYLDRSTGTQSVSVFKDRLSSHLPTTPTAVTILPTTSPRLGWATESQLRYRVLKSEDLIHWTFVEGLILGDASPTAFEDLSVADRCFYRVMGFK